MNMYGRDPWGASLEINAADSATDDDRSRNLNDLDRAALSRTLDETQQSWLLGPAEQKKKKKYVDLGCIIVSRKIFGWTVGSIVAAALVAGLIILIGKTVPRHRHNHAPADYYSLALHNALMFFNAQRSGKLPKHNNVSWRGSSCLSDGKGKQGSFYKDLEGGYYDAGDAIKFHFPASFAMTMLSWSVIEYSAKYEAAGELSHVKEIIKWGADYFLKTFNSSADTINTMVAQLATNPGIAKHAGAFWGGPDYGVLSWDNKLAGAQLLLSRLRLFLNPGYPYEEILRTFHNQTSIIMCSYMPIFTKFNRTRGGLIELNHGRPQPLQYVVNAAFLATLYSDYLEAADTPGWYCGPNFYSTNELRDFAKTQIDYILGKNPRKMSYVVGFGNHYPKHVHHRGASIPKNKIRYNCKGGWKWRDTMKPNPNTLVGAMVAGPDSHDGFRDVRTNYNYTEPTIAGNAGLAAALVALSGEKTTGIDKSTIFSAVPPMFPTLPTPPAPWRP